MTDLEKRLVEIFDEMLKDEKIPKDIRTMYSNKVDKIFGQTNEIDEEKYKFKGIVIECKRLPPTGLLGNIFGDERFSIVIDVEGEIKIYNSRTMFFKCKNKKNVILEYTQEILDEENSLKSLFYHIEGPDVYDDRP